MKFLFLLFVVAVVLIITRAEQLTFGQDGNSLRKCIEDHLSKDSNLKMGKIVENITAMISSSFSYKSYTELQFQKSINYLYFKIKNEKAHLFKNNVVPEQLPFIINYALRMCVERYNLPRFGDELRVLGDLLDFILVDWPTPVKEMIRTHEGRSTLRHYAYAVGVRLISALRNYEMDYQMFRRELRRIWMLRAQQLYDGRINEIPYIRHRFTTNSDRMYSSIPLEDIHTMDDVKSFESRKVRDFSNRNPIVRQRNWVSSSCPEDDVYIEYSRYGVTSAENYLEDHIDRCYRILFFILELQLRGINTDEDDIYDGPIPSVIMQPFTQEIVRISKAYRSYLTSLQQYLEQLPVEELGCCSSSGTIEELITRLTLSIAKKTNFTTTTTTSTSTELPGYVGGFKKGGTRTRDCGKYFLPNKKFRAILPKPDNQSNQVGESANYYHGYVTYKGDFKQLKFFETDPLMLPEILVALNRGAVLAAVNSTSCN